MHDALIFSGLAIALIVGTIMIIMVMRKNAGLGRERQSNRTSKKPMEPYRVQAFMTMAITGGDEVPLTPTYCLGEAQTTDQYQRLERSAPPGHFRIEIVPVTMEEYREHTAMPV